MQPDILLVAESLDVVDMDAHDVIEGVPDVVSLFETDAVFETVTDVVTDELEDGDKEPE